MRLAICPNTRNQRTSARAFARGGSPVDQRSHRGEATLQARSSLNPREPQWTSNLVVPPWSVSAMAGTLVGIANQDRQRRFISVQEEETLSVWFASAPK